MANNVDQKLRVVAEADFTRLQDAVKKAVASLLGIEGAGEKAGEGVKQSFEKSDKAADNLRKTLDGNIKTALSKSIGRWAAFGDAAETAGNRASKSVNGASETIDALGKRINTTIKAIVVGVAAKKITEALFINPAKEAAKTEEALSSVASLGVEDLERIRKAAKDFTNEFSGTTRVEFINSLYDIKSGIASLTDEGVAKMTEFAAITGRATKAAVGEMTTLFAQGHGIYANQFKDDFDFGEQFSAGIAQSIKLFRTSGTEMSSFVSALGASAASAGAGLSDILAVGGSLQSSMSGSEAATRMKAFYEAAYKAGDKLNLKVTDTSGRLKSVADIIDLIKQRYGDVLSAAEANELSEAFGTQEAVALITQLYNKTGDLREVQSEISGAMSKGIEFTRTMAGIVDNNAVAKIDIFKNRISNLGDTIGQGLQPTVMTTFDKFNEALDELEANGAIDTVAESVKRIAELISNLLVNVLRHAPSILSSIADGISRISTNIANLAKWLAAMAGLTGALNVLKGIALIASGISTFPAGAPMILSGVALLTKGAGIAVAANYAGNLVSSGGQTNQSAKSANTTNASNTANTANNTAAKTVKTVRKIEPGKQAENTTKTVKTARKLEPGESVTSASASVPVAATPVAAPVNVTPIEVDAIPISTKTGGSSNKAISTTPLNTIKTEKEDERTPLEKGIDELEDKYSSIESVIQSRIDLAEAAEDEQSEIHHMESLTDMLKEKLAKAVSLSDLAKTADERNVLETLQNSIQTKIYNVLSNIDESASKALQALTGSFNAPLEAINQYTYDTLNNNNITRHVALNVYGVNELNEAGIRKLAQKVGDMLNVNSKSGLVHSGFMDVLRN